jgi:ribosomal protein L32E
MHSKMRMHRKYRPNVVSIGYRGPKKARGLHPSGFKEVFVHNPKDVEKVDPETEAIRIAGSVGTKKREAIEERIQELEDKKDMKYYVLNPLKKYDIVTVYQPSDLDNLDRKEQAAFIHPRVGKNVRQAIIEKAKEMAESKKGGVKVLNVKKGVMD